MSHGLNPLLLNSKPTACSLLPYDHLPSWPLRMSWQVAGLGLVQPWNHDLLTSTSFWHGDSEQLRLLLGVCFLISKRVYEPSYRAQSPGEVEFFSAGHGHT
jgi:hypothetical protein